MSHQAKEGIADNWKAQLAAMDAADIIALRECFTDDAVLVHMIGYRQPLDEWMRGIESEEFVYHQVIEKGVSISVLPHSEAKVVGDIITGYRADGTGQAWPLHVEQKFVQENGCWLCAESIVNLGR